MARTNFDTEKLKKKQHLLLAIRAALVTGEESALCKFVEEYRCL